MAPSRGRCGKGTTLSNPVGWPDESSQSGRSVALVCCQPATIHPICNNITLQSFGGVNPSQCQEKADQAGSGIKATPRVAWIKPSGLMEARLTELAQVGQRARNQASCTGP